MSAIVPVDPEASGSEPKFNSLSGGMAPLCVTFGSAAVYPRARELRVNGELVEIYNCAFEILLMLIEANGQIVPKKELFRRVWPNTCVVETNLRVHLYKLRKALGENGKAIKTVNNRGYLLTARVMVRHGEWRDRAAEHRELPEATSVRRSRAGAVVIIIDKGNDVRAALNALLRSGIPTPESDWPAL